MSVNDDRMAAMTEATALTRAGRLAEATAVIRGALSGSPSGPEGRAGGEAPEDDPRPDGPGHRRAPDRAVLRGLRDRLARTGARTRAGARLDLARQDTVPAAPGPDAATAGRTSVHVHRNAAGDRPYTLHVPAPDAGPWPLVVMLHGGTQTAAEFAAATRMSLLAQEHGFLVAYPEQVTSANAMRSW